MRVQCPPTAFSAAHPTRTETSARPVSKSSSKQHYIIPRPSKRPHVGPGCGTNSSVKISDPMPVLGHSRHFDRAHVTSGLPPKNGHRRTDRVIPVRARSGHVGSSGLSQSKSIGDPSGKSLRSARDGLSSPLCENILVFRKTKSVHISIVPSHRGAARDRHGRGTGCGGREGALDEQR